MPETSLTPADPIRSGAVIAAPSRNDVRGYSGRYLHGATDPGITAHLLHELITVRYPGKLGARRAVTELIGQHPAGWRQFGSATANDPAITPRRAPARAGTCYCHTPEGTWTETMRKALEAMLRTVENEAARGGYRDNCDLLPRSSPGDGSPLLINGGGEPDWVEYLYVIRPEALDVKTRDGAYPRGRNAFVTIGLVPWGQPVDIDEINRAVEAAHARTIADIADEHAADTFALIARELEAMPADHGLVTLLLQGHRSYHHTPPEHAPTVLLADAAGVRASELPAHLEALARSEQISLLRRAAHHIHPAEHRAA
jgi:hypothetical protein